MLSFELGLRVHLAASEGLVDGPAAGVREAGQVVDVFAHDEPVVRLCAVLLYLIESVSGHLLQIYIYSIFLNDEYIRIGIICIEFVRNY